MQRFFLTGYGTFRVKPFFGVNQFVGPKYDNHIMCLLPLADNLCGFFFLSRAIVMRHPTSPHTLELSPRCPHG